ncbi:two component sensor kinase [Kaistia sp. 32K]|uniref:sensor histidine kinase n=1 Tax=Kaistia sp. 32K TaxID=2795690 RepID=UPI001915809B|nr:ATP-binding protein [Kaistia sp. 32K]BCP52343.1 two component sensor kinase [Kaistia sp. 32K]
MLRKAVSRVPAISRSTVVLAMLIALMTVIFVVDTVTDYAVAAAVLYTAVLLIATQFLSVRTVVILTGASVLLTLVSFELTRSGAYEVGIINTTISVVVIGVTAYLGLKLKSAEQSAHEARERLLRMARLTTLGQLTTSIAHEVSQPLGAIATSASACSRWLAQEPPNVEKALAAVERIAGDANRASDILARVRGMARSEAPRKAEFDFNQAVREVLELSQGDMTRTGAEVSLSLAEGLPAAFADRVQIQQVVGNLVLNAMEAASALPDRTLRLAIASELEPAGKIRFSISDNGPGLSSETAQHLFDAFWTTKERGFGLGLTISRAIVENNGGHIWTQPVAGGPGVIFLFNVKATGAAA